MPANSASAGSQKRVTGTRGRIPLAGLVLAALPAVNILPPLMEHSNAANFGAAQPVIGGVSGADAIMP